MAPLCVGRGWVQRGCQRSAPELRQGPPGATGSSVSFPWDFLTKRNISVSWPMDSPESIFFKSLKVTLLEQEL